MNCPQCFELLHWFNDNTCDEVYFCECGDGFVGQYVCGNEECSVSLITITVDCKGCIY